MPTPKTASTPPSVPAGETSAKDLTRDTPSTQPALPHERDQQVGMTDGVPSKEVRQAHRDVERGLKDTSRAPEADAAYDQLKKKP